MSLSPDISYMRITQNGIEIEIGGKEGDHVE